MLTKSKQCTSRIPNDEVFCICSLCSETIVYKGQVTPEQLLLYFAGDLHHPLYKTHLALVHPFLHQHFPLVGLRSASSCVGPQSVGPHSEINTPWEQELDAFL